jgi:hypothetical protein
MLGIEIALLVGGALLFVVVAGLIGGRLGSRSEAHRHRLQGQRNAGHEQRRLEERCTVCGEPIDPARDVWDTGQWWHQGCYRELLR